MMCGAKVVSLYPQEAPDSVAYKLMHSDAQIAVVENADNLQLVENALPFLTQLKAVVVLPPGEQYIHDAKIAYTGDGAVLYDPEADNAEDGEDLVDSKEEET